jgi:N-acetylmuramoyl-L-alanine amidase
MFKKVFGLKKIALYISVIIVTYVVTTLILMPYNNAVRAGTYSYGSNNNIVVEIQRRLKAWGYYDGNLDGAYGYRTYIAVRKFQSVNGLTVDGVVGNRTLEALGINDGTGGAANAKNYTSDNQDVYLLARLINGEARGEPYEGQVAVGAVVLNRTRDSRFASTIAGVIYAPGAFTCVSDGQINSPLEQTSINASRDALNGWDPSGGAVYYFNPATATNAWIWSRPLIKIIGSHRFCR